MGNTVNYFICLRRNSVAQVKNNSARLTWNMTGSVLGNVHIKSYIVIVYLIYIEYKMHKMPVLDESCRESIAGENITNPDMRLYYLITKCSEEPKQPLMRTKEESEKVGFKFSRQRKFKIIYPVPLFHIRWWYYRFHFLGFKKSPADSIAATKMRRQSLRVLRLPRYIKAVRHHFSDKKIHIMLRFLLAVTMIEESNRRRHKELMFSNCSAGEDFESPWIARRSN